MRKPNHMSKRNTASRTAGVYTTLSLNISPLFDLMNFAVAEAFPRAPEGKPHCDCKLANEAYFNKTIKQYGQPDSDAAYSMVPVTPNNDGTCPHCGYYTAKLPPQVYSFVSTKEKPKKVGKRLAVKGTNVNTGETVTYPSQQKAAREAGYGTFKYALASGKPDRNGWRWEVVEA